MYEVDHIMLLKDCYHKRFHPHHLKFGSGTVMIPLLVPNITPLLCPTIAVMGTCISTGIVFVSMTFIP